MVRLKVIGHLLIINSPGFQFQYGTIKRIVAMSAESVGSLFQFQYGTIKSMWPAQ